MDDPLVEAPCEVTKQACRFICVDEETDADGELLSWDVYCADCYRWRDWSKDEAPTATEPSG